MEGPLGWGGKVLGGRDFSNGMEGPWGHRGPLGVLRAPGGVLRPLGVWRVRGGVEGPWRC